MELVLNTRNITEPGHYGFTKTKAAEFVEALKKDPTFVVDLSEYPVPKLTNNFTDFRKAGYAFVLRFLDEGDSTSTTVNYFFKSCATVHRFDVLTEVTLGIKD
jgi:hypothetical protein